MAQFKLLRTIVPRVLHSAKFVILKFALQQKRTKKGHLVDVSCTKIGEMSRIKSFMLAFEWIFSLIVFEQPKNVLKLLI